MGRDNRRKNILTSKPAREETSYSLEYESHDPSSALVSISTAIDAPIVSSYNDRIRPLLDAVDRLRHLKIMQEGIQLPTIVVVGDQSSGKSSVLESLAGISLPRGQGICTRVPLIMRLQNHLNPHPELFLEYDGKVVPTDEDNIANAIAMATDEIAGNGKGISNHPLTLVVKKQGVPDLTMVDLPGITRVPVHGQPEDIYEQVSMIIQEYITPEESIILNVLSASVDFSTCESIRMSQRVDKTGQRTLAVVTKADRSPEGLLEKVTSDDVNIGLGYICVRNRIGDESYEAARAEEAALFQTHPQLSKISKSMVGIPILAHKLVQVQAAIIVKCLPDIVRKINEKLSSNVEDLNKLPRNMTSVAEAMTAFMHVLGSAKESLRKILLRGEFDEYPDTNEMHCTARLAEMLNQYSEEMQSRGAESDGNADFLLAEIKVLEETKSIGLPNFLPRAAFLTLLQKKVKAISFTPFEFVEKTWNYIETVVVSVLMKHADNYPQLMSSTRRASQNLVALKKQQSVDWVIDSVEMEKLTDYTCNPEYVSLWNKLMSYQNAFMEILNDHSKPTNLCMDGFGDVDIGHLRSKVVAVQEAFDLKMRLAAYWKIVLRRMVDCMALHLLFSIQNLVNKEMEEEIINEIVGVEGRGLDKMLEESPAIAEKRKRLNNSIKLLKESKEVVSKIMDQISTLSFGN
ncbi:Dynamin related protein 4C [Perilla frutescens var. hirtella]|uniref:Dynamin related protein 4C n=1 Tax=Perilla frutescens var. hirtella TaxID=608512 RepID=A0AAD4JLQ5_PERFH|nr:Dynamin related protein 4C [Perilla frutescens var. hirtella]